MSEKRLFSKEDLVNKNTVDPKNKVANSEKAISLWVFPNTSDMYKTLPLNPNNNTKIKNAT
ncbi:hypothetical protein GCM10022258_41310 [Aquimarina gracilis]